VSHLVVGDLAACEAVIERGLATFVEVGEALLVIRDERLYRESHATFEDYCRERWSLSRARAYQLIGAAEVVSTVVDNGLPAPMTERQARELARVPEPERADVWREALERTEGKPTAAAVREIAHPSTRSEPEPEPVAESTIEDYVESGAAVRRARLRHDLMSWLRRAQVFDLEPDEVADLIEGDEEWARIQRRRDDLARYFDAILAARPRGLRMIGGRNG